jgi:hypothetical protein
MTMQVESFREAKDVLREVLDGLEIRREGSPRRVVGTQHYLEELTALLDVAALLESAAETARRIEAGQEPADHIDSIAERAAHALHRLRKLSERLFPDSPMPEIHFATDRSAELDEARKDGHGQEKPA